VLDWFEKFDFSTTNFPVEKGINIADRFLDETINFFDQRVANEGFLFYFTN